MYFHSAQNILTFLLRFLLWCMCLSSIYFGISSLILCGLKADIIWFFFFNLGVFYGPEYGLFWWIPWDLEKNVYSVVTGCLCMLILPSWVMVLLSSAVSVLNFCLLHLSISDGWSLHLWQCSHLILFPFPGTNADCHSQLLSYQWPSWKYIRKWPVSKWNRHFNEGSQVTEKGLRVGWCCSLRIKNGWTHCWWECKMVELFWKRVWQFLNMLKRYHMIQQFYS